MSSTSEKVIVTATGFIAVAAAVIIAVVIFKNKEEQEEAFGNVKGNKNRGAGAELSNPLYTSDNIRAPGAVLYTQPPGDVKAQEFAGSGAGTNGEYMPLQGRAAGLFMRNSTTDGMALGSNSTGRIGGYPNYVGEDAALDWIGFNDFGTPKRPTNSYLIQGANERVANPGSKSDGLQCPDTWPQTFATPSGYCLQGSDLLATCDGSQISDCPDSKAYLAFKNASQWQKVMGQVNS